VESAVGKHTVEQETNEPTVTKNVEAVTEEKRNYHDVSRDPPNGKITGFCFLYRLLFVA
jgi:hypothetical protein